MKKNPDSCGSCGVCLLPDGCPKKAFSSVSVVVSESVSTHPSAENAETAEKIVEQSQLGSVSLEVPVTSQK